MIRYVAISEEAEVIPETDCFAWFTTVTDSFMMFAGDQVWANWADFEESYRLHHGTKTDLVRFQRLYQGTG